MTTQQPPDGVAGLSDQAGGRDGAPPRRALPIGPLALLIVSVLGVAAVLWGALVADPGISVSQVDAGPIDRFAIGEVVVLADLDFYLVGLEDGRLRAVDGRIEDSECRVRYLPDDRRGRALNPTGIAGVLIDPCSEAVWSVGGDAIAGAGHPLRTPQVSFRHDEQGVLHVWVERISLAATD